MSDIRIELDVDYLNLLEQICKWLDPRDQIVLTSKSIKRTRIDEIGGTIREETVYEGKVRNI